MKTKLKAKRPSNIQQLKSAAANAWQSITKEELKLKVCISIASQLFHFKSIVVKCDPKIIQFVLFQIFLALTVHEEGVYATT